MGGWATIKNASEEWTTEEGGPKVGAAFLLHPWGNAKVRKSLDSRVPIFYSTG
jgi:hypothetical protein